MQGGTSGGNPKILLQHGKPGWSKSSVRAHLEEHHGIRFSQVKINNVNRIGITATTVAQALASGNRTLCAAGEEDRPCTSEVTVTRPVPLCTPHRMEVAAGVLPLTATADASRTETG